MARRWFRFGKKQEEPATEQAAAQEEVAPPEAPTELEAIEPAADETPAGQKKRRRRGSRGGRGRRKPVTAAAQAEDLAPADAAGEATPKAASRKAGSNGLVQADRILSVASTGEAGPAAVNSTISRFGLRSSAPQKA